PPPPPSSPTRRSSDPATIHVRRRHPRPATRRTLPSRRPHRRARLTDSISFMLASEVSLRLKPDSRRSAQGLSAASVVARFNVGDQSGSRNPPPPTIRRSRPVLASIAYNPPPPLELTNTRCRPSGAQLGSSFSPSVVN